ncbi:MAG: hypothetical protein H7343_09570 [Undibacterium sp.]|nr:hypothetical protein [Opitutaceae bacterium]
MMTTNVRGLIGVAGFAGVLGSASLVAAEYPAREYIAAKGWTVGFAPGDRAVATGVVAHLDVFEKKLVAIEAIKSELSVAELERRTGELAKLAAAIGRLPAREDDFRRELERVIVRIKELNGALREALFMRKIELWQTAEVRERLGAGEQLAGFKWDAKEQRPAMQINFNAQFEASDYRVTKTLEMPPAISLRLDGKGDTKAQMAAAVKSFDVWAKIARDMDGGMGALAVRMALPMAFETVLKKECVDEASSRWIRAGLTGWLWRELVVRSVPAKAAGKYAVLVAQLPVPRPGMKPVNLEVWPEKDQGDFPLLARQVFINIAESDGAESLERLLTAFWELPREQRTTANLRRLYREQMKTGIEARAPLRSLGAAVN